MRSFGRRQQPPHHHGLAGRIDADAVHVRHLDVLTRRVLPARVIFAALVDVVHLEPEVRASPCSTWTMYWSE